MGRTQYGTFYSEKGTAGLQLFAHTPDERRQRSDTLSSESSAASSNPSELHDLSQVGSKGDRLKHAAGEGGRAMWKAVTGQARRDRKAAEELARREAQYMHQPGSPHQNIY